MEIPAMVHITFYITYVLLLTTGTITFIEAVSTKSPQVRHIMNLETCISLVAAFFYSQFVQKLSANELNYREITLTRYTDWFITTPLMLMVLMLVLGHDKIPLHLATYITVVILNFGMLLIGYLGERQVVKKNTGLIIGFLFFFAIFGVIGYIYMGDNSIENWIIYLAFCIVWSVYGVVYMMDDKIKNITFNILDLIAKCLIGIFFWIYFTKVIVW